MLGIIRVNGRTYHVPQEDFAITNAYDNHLHVYRISLGIPNVEGFEKAFAAIDRSTDGAFFEGNIEFIDNNGKLQMAMAMVSKTITPFGTFYELEAVPSDTKLVKENHEQHDYNRGNSSTESKALDGDSAVTATKKRRSRRIRPIRG